jgi:hypothetical protein
MLIEHLVGNLGNLGKLSHNDESQFPIFHSARAILFICTDEKHFLKSLAYHFHLSKVVIPGAIVTQRIP